MDTIASMRAFVAVAKTGSFSAAAQKLDLVPSVITKRVTQLERIVGTTLFHRSTRKVVLSADGEHHLERIIAAIAWIIPSTGPLPNRSVQRSPPSANVGLLRRSIRLEISRWELSSSGSAEASSLEASFERYAAAMVMRGRSGMLTRRRDLSATVQFRFLEQADVLLSSMFVLECITDSSQTSR